MNQIRSRPRKDARLIHNIHGIYVDAQIPHFGTKFSNKKVITHLSTTSTMKE